MYLYVGSCYLFVDSWKKKPNSVQAFKQAGNPKKLSFGGMWYGAAVTVIDGLLSWLFRETCQEEEKEKDKKGKNMEDDNIPN